MLTIKLSTPAAELITTSADAVNVPTDDGYLGIYKGHTPLIAQLGTGIATIPASSLSFFVALGIMSVSDNRVEILADVAETKGQIDLKRAEASKLRAERRLREALHSEMDIVRASASLRRALTRISFLGG